MLLITIFVRFFVSSMVEHGRVLGVAANLDAHSETDGRIVRNVNRKQFIIIFKSVAKGKEKDRDGSGQSKRTKKGP